MVRLAARDARRLMYAAFVCITSRDESGTAANLYMGAESEQLAAFLFLSHVDATTSTQPTTMTAAGRRQRCREELAERRERRAARGWRLEAPTDDDEPRVIGKYSQQAYRPGGIYKQEYRQVPCLR